MMVRLSLTGAYQGKTVVLNGYQFVDGVMEFEGSNNECSSLANYFIVAYQAKAEIDPNDEVVQETPEEDVSKEPDIRQAKIIEAVTAIDKSEWSGDPARPKVSDVAGLMEDATVTKEEILEVIERWLSE